MLRAMLELLLFDNEIHAAAFLDDRFHEGFDGQMIGVILVSR
jgi:hypothetical protein